MDNILFSLAPKRDQGLRTNGSFNNSTDDYSLSNNEIHIEMTLDYSQKVELKQEIKSALMYLDFEETSEYEVADLIEDVVIKFLEDIK